MVFSQFTEPAQVTLELTSQERWVAPRHRLGPTSVSTCILVGTIQQNTNPYVCQDQSPGAWSAVITGPENLNVNTWARGIGHVLFWEANGFGQFDVIHVPTFGNTECHA